MKKIVTRALFSLICLLSLNANAQNNEWTLFKEDQGIKFYYKYADCDFQNAIDAQWVLLKIENTTDQNLFIEYSLFNYFNGKCYLCENDPNGEARKEVKLQPHTSVQGECEPNCPKSLRIFSKFLEFKTNDLLTKFEIKDIILTEIKD